LFDDIPVTAGEIHLGAGADRICAQGFFDPARGHHEFPAVERPQQTQTADAVADGNLVGSLLWLPDRTSRSMLSPDSANRCSIQVSGRASAVPCR
jgi:hypothetical protein